MENKQKNIAYRYRIYGSGNFRQHVAILDDMAIELVISVDAQRR